MKIGIKKIAKLANIQLSSEEEKKYEKDLNNILSYMENLEKVNTDNIEPTNQSTSVTGQEREDVFYTDGIFNIQEKLISSSKYKNDKFIEIPPVL